MSDRELICEQRIGDALARRRELFLRDTSNMTDDEREAHESEASESILSIEPIKRYTILLSWGGPSDGLRIDFNQHGECIGGEYFFQDWFDGATRSLSYDEAEQLADILAIGPNFE